MKKSNYFIFLIFLAGLSTLTLTSCETEGCTDPEATNFDEGADIENNMCEYERDAFLGSYNVNENCDSGNFTYTCNISQSSSSVSEVIINNFGDFNVNVRATVSGSGLTFNDNQSGINFSGSGSLAGTTLTIIYTASQAGYTDSCTKTAIKQ